MGTKNFHPNQKVEPKYFDNLKLTKTIKTISDFNIFPNGNLLVYSGNALTLYEPIFFKEVFKYEIDNLSNIIILSNTSLLLYNLGSPDYYSILDIGKPINTIKIKFKHEIEDKERISFLKLENNHILFYYIYKNHSHVKTRYEPNVYYYSLTFYIYDEKNLN